MFTTLNAAPLRGGTGLGRALLLSSARDAKRWLVMPLAFSKFEITADEASSVPATVLPRGNTVDAGLVSASPRGIVGAWLS